MKKTALATFACAALLITGCSANQVKDAVNTVTNSTTEATATPAPTNTPAPKETTVALGKKAKIGDWNVCVKKVSVTQKIQNGKYRYFKPSKGNSYVLFSLSARNNGKKNETFLPSVGLANKMNSAILYYKDEYEYKPTQLLSYDKDLLTKKIQPLTTKSGVIAFEVPKKVAKAKKQLKLKIGTKSENVTYPLGN